MSDKIETVAVKRKGGRGWHWINKSAFDPAVHFAHDPTAEAEAAKVAEEEAAKKAKK